ncbi:hypothetical protein [Enterococcus casseliflavus]|nr:hypothetical protein [Enterococcus casseliflavus]
MIQEAKIRPEQMILKTKMRIDGIHDRAKESLLSQQGERKCDWFV